VYPAQGELTGLIASYGSWVVAVGIGLESMGVPLPGETLLVSAALYAGSTGRLSIVGVVIAAAAGAILGDNLGFWIGRDVGYRWLLRRGSLLHLSPGRLKIGQYLFRRHGGKVVFFGRFVAILRALAAFLAGINCMPWRRFLFFNAAGGVLWAAAYGFGAYAFGEALTRIAGPLGIMVVVAAAACVAAGWIFVRKHEARLQAEADRALPGPLRP
jgi:membrane protein DedA with SNARE-associated domain